MSPIGDFLERLRGETPEVTRKDLSSGRWLWRYARLVLISTDALLFLCSGIAVALFAEFFKRVESDGEAILLALTAIGFAALAVALTALSIFVSLVNDAYLRVLTMRPKHGAGGSGRGGMAAYIVPYLTAGLISAITTIFGAVGAVIYKVFSSAWPKALILGVEVGLVVWASWAVFQLVIEVAIHGLNRYELTQRARARGPNIESILRRAEADQEEEAP